MMRAVGRSGCRAGASGAMSKVALRDHHNSRRNSGWNTRSLTQVRGVIKFQVSFMISPGRVHVILEDG